MYSVTNPSLSVTVVVKVSRGYADMLLTGVIVASGSIGVGDGNVVVVGVACVSVLLLLHPTSDN